MRTEPFLESHPVTLTQSEVDERAHEAAAVGLKVEAKAKELEAFVESAKLQKKLLENEGALLAAKLYELGRIVKNRREPREVECVERLAGHVVQTIREDTGEVVSSRPATRTEIEEAMQEPLFPGGGTTKAPPKKKSAKAGEDVPAH
jgi:hypothetical protein